MIMDLQFGSTGKGQVAGTLAHDRCPDTVVTAWGPNAGHTFRHGDLKMVTTMLASSSVTPSIENILIGPGSVLKLDSLINEMLTAGKLLHGKTLIIHPQTPLWRPAYAEMEAANLKRIGSTMKGTGEALIHKVRRQPTATIIGFADHEPHDIYAQFDAVTQQTGCAILVDETAYNNAVDASKYMFVEGAQGFGLGYHTSFYPYCTSRDVSPAQLLADCRLPIQEDLEVIGICRTYPIRVANRFDEHGNMVGHSGGYFPDQNELQWSDIGRQPELTTVTKLPRRLFNFSIQQIQDACRIVRPNEIALTFCDYLEPVDAGEGDRPRIRAVGEVEKLVNSIQRSLRDAKYGAPNVGYLSYGPNSCDLYYVKKRSDGLLPALIIDRLL